MEPKEYDPCDLTAALYCVLIDWMGVQSALLVDCYR